MTRRLASLAVLAVLAAAAPAPVDAASQQPLDLSQMVGHSDEIVVGRVVSSAASWQGRLIVTVAEIEVEEAIKGPLSPTIRITQLGGTAVHPQTGLSITMTASTQVALQPGEDVLLFVSRGAGGERQLVGAQQGRLPIRENPQTHVREIPVGPKRLEVLRGADRDRVSAARMTLDEMRERIRSYLRPGGGGDRR